ncbi:hypothetical protein CDAR_469851 [Caerostris darwini]|uniref:Uncharacterized protein n=1 Tax=Caerostris darwini TaxID=1538125 RepID=A0AAV4TYW2_9ARAC|nr:hypothetical protein CDAR_469851 [Caerostris darwini]
MEWKSEIGNASPVLSVLQHRGEVILYEDPNDAISAHGSYSYRHQLCRSDFLEHRSRAKSNLTSDPQSTIMPTKTTYRD